MGVGGTKQAVFEEVTPPRWEDMGVGEGPPWRDQVSVNCRLKQIHRPVSFQWGSQVNAKGPSHYFLGKQPFIHVGTHR